MNGCSHRTLTHTFQPQTPLSRLINTRMTDQGISCKVLVQRLGWANPSRGLRRLDQFMATGEATSHLLKALADVLELDMTQVEAAAASTCQQIADAEEADARDRFQPRILVLAKRQDGVRHPAFLQMFAFGQKMLGLPEEFPACHRPCK